MSEQYWRDDERRALRVAAGVVACGLAAGAFSVWQLARPPETSPSRSEVVYQLGFTAATYFCQAGFSLRIVGLDDHSETNTDNVAVVHLACESESGDRSAPIAWQEGLDPEGYEVMVSIQKQLSPPQITEDAMVVRGTPYHATLHDVVVLPPRLERSDVRLP